VDADDRLDGYRAMVDTVVVILIAFLGCADVSADGAADFVVVPLQSGL
jgi:hypothetical protein